MLAAFLKKEGFWRRTVRGQAGSGLTVRAWCRRRGFREATFYWWRAELVRRDAETVCGGTFVPVRVVPDTPAGAMRNEPPRKIAAAFSGRDGHVPAATAASNDATIAAGRIEIVLAGGRQVRVSGRVDRAVLADVLAVLMSANPVESEGRRTFRVNGWFTSWRRLESPPARRRCQACAPAAVPEATKHCGSVGYRV